MYNSTENAIPFRVDRGLAVSLIEQVTAGLRSAIAEGYYAAGGRLPSIGELARAAEVSEIVVRGALSRLVKEGLVISRRFSGTVVAGGDLRAWKGHVLIVTSDRRDTFYFGSVVAVVRDALFREGYQVSQVVVPLRNHRNPDFGQFDAAVARGAKLAIVIKDRFGIAAHSIRSGIPTVVFGSTEKPLSGAVGHVHYDADAWVADFTTVCRRNGIKALHGVFALTVPQSLVAALSAAGLTVESSVFKPADVPDSIEMNQRGAMDFILGRLRTDRHALDGKVLLLADDYSAAGVITALLYRGVRIPEDVRLVTLINCGNPPFLPISVAGYENDPIAHGEAVARCALRCLSGERGLVMERVGTVFRDGETLSPGRLGRNTKKRK